MGGQFKTIEKISKSKKPRLHSRDASNVLLESYGNMNTLDRSKRADITDSIAQAMYCPIKNASMAQPRI